MLAETAAALSGLKGAIDIVKGVSSLKTSVEMAEFKSDLLDKLLETQLSLIDLTERLSNAQQQVRELTAEVRKGDDWASLAATYALANTGRGAKAYHPIDQPASARSGDWACPACWEEKRRILLVPEANDWHGSLTCPSCKWSVTTYSNPLPAPRNDRGDGWGY